MVKENQHDIFQMVLNIWCFITLVFWKNHYVSKIISDVKLDIRINYYMKSHR